jgi:cardiolipin synthase
VKARDIPNLICFIRILLVPPVVVFLLRGDFAIALALFALAGASDGLDGFLARRYNWRSRLGGILDPLADKLLMAATYITLGWLALLPSWLVVLVLGRDVVIILGSLAFHHFVSDIELEPSRISKANTLFQILLVMLVMAVPIGLALPPWVVTVMIAMVIITTLLSGGHYVWSWSRLAIEIKGGTRE